FEPEQLPNRQAGELPAEIVQCGVDGRLSRLLSGPLAEPRVDRLERERVVSEQRGRLLDERERRFGRLLVALDRGRLAVTGDALVRELDEHDLRLVRGAARDDERLRHPQRHDPGVELHGDTLEPRWRTATSEGWTRTCPGRSGSCSAAGSSTRSGTGWPSRSSSSTSTTCAGSPSPPPASRSLSEASRRSSPESGPARSSTGSAAATRSCSASSSSPQPSRSSP